MDCANVLRDWEIATNLENLRSYRSTYQKRINRLESSIDELSEKITHGPEPVTGVELDSYKFRQYTVNKYNEAM